MGKMSDHEISVIKCFPCEYKLVSFARLSASFRQHVHAYEFAPDAGKEKKHLIGTNYHKTVVGYSDSRLLNESRL